MSELAQKIEYDVQITLKKIFVLSPNFTEPKVSVSLTLGKYLKRLRNPRYVRNATASFYNERLIIRTSTSSLADLRAFITIYAVSGNMEREVDCIEIPLEKYTRQQNLDAAEPLNAKTENFELEAEIQVVPKYNIYSDQDMGSEEYSFGNDTFTPQVSVRQSSPALKKSNSSTLDNQKKDPLLNRILFEQIATSEPKQTEDQTFPGNLVRRSLSHIKTEVLQIRRQVSDKYSNHHLQIVQEQRADKPERDKQAEVEDECTKYFIGNIGMADTVQIVSELGSLEQLLSDSSPVHNYISPFIQVQPRNQDQQSKPIVRLKAPPLDLTGFTRWQPRTQFKSQGELLSASRAASAGSKSLRAHQKRFPFDESTILNISTEQRQCLSARSKYSRRPASQINESQKAKSARKLTYSRKQSYKNKDNDKREAEKKRVQDFRESLRIKKEIQELKLHLYCAMDYFILLAVAVTCLFAGTLLRRIF